MIRVIVTSLVAAVTINACARPAPTQTARIVTNDSCSQRPASWPNSQFRVALGATDSTLDAQTGALIVDVRVDSIPASQGAQVSLIRGAMHRDAAYKDSVTRITAPAGQYVLRARRIGAQTLSASVDVRSGFVDTVKVLLGREVVCLDVRATARQ